MSAARHVSRVELNSNSSPIRWEQWVQTGSHSSLLSFGTVKLNMMSKEEPRKPLVFKVPDTNTMSQTAVTSIMHCAFGFFIPLTLVLFLSSPLKWAPCPWWPSPPWCTLSLWCGRPIPSAQSQGHRYDLTHNEVTNQLTLKQYNLEVLRSGHV